MSIKGPDSDMFWEIVFNDSQLSLSTGSGLFVGLGFKLCDHIYGKRIKKVFFPTFWGYTFSLILKLFKGSLES